MMQLLQGMPAGPMPHSPTCHSCGTLLRGGKGLLHLHHPAATLRWQLDMEDVREADQLLQKPANVRMCDGGSAEDGQAGALSKHECLVAVHAYARPWGPNCNTTEPHVPYPSRFMAPTSFPPTLKGTSEETCSAPLLFSSIRFMKPLRSVGMA